MHSLQLTDSGLYCPAGDFTIDPWRPVRAAVVTHAHADHARPGSMSYLCARPGEMILKTRLGDDAQIRSLKYGESLTLGAVRVSLHPAGHLLGSAQVRIEHRGHVTVVSGDYKTQADATCLPMEPLRCHRFISESTFGLPVFRWPAQDALMADINGWWRASRLSGRSCLLFAYALGKAQRILAGLDASIGPIFTHGAVEKFNRCYRLAGVRLPDTRYVGDVDDPKQFEGAMVIAPPSADNPLWTKKFPPHVRGFASGWMQIRGNRRRRSVDRGFVLSDHADWDGLLAAIGATGAETVGVTHGYAAEMARWLQEKGRRAEVIPTRFVGEEDTDDQQSTD
jgi:putative mRNA 3-end processing factor